MKILHIAIREDDGAVAQALLTQLCEVASDGQDDLDAYVYRAWVEDIQYGSSAQEQQT